MKKPNRSVFLSVFLLLTCSTTALAQVDIPENKWVAKPLGPRGSAPCQGGCKHMRLAHNPNNGLIYALGGDHNNLPGGGWSTNGRQEIFTYSIASDEWRLEQSYCREDQGLQPSGPDETGWVFDTSRQKFWMVPGFQWDWTGVCPGGNTIRDKIMSYDPATKTWQNTGTNGLGGFYRFAQYDPVKDVIVMFRDNSAHEYNIGTNLWNNFKVINSSTKIIGDEYVATDLESRTMYIIENKHDGRLYQYDMDQRTLTDVGPLPASRTANKESHAIWDSINKVLLWPLWADDANPVILMMYVYHPDSQTWEEIPVVHPDGETVRGRHSVFDPYENVLMVMGSKSGTSPVFLYRYGNGSGSIPEGDAMAPAAPTALMVE